MDADNEPQEFGLVQSFFIDTDGYTDRDRLMFVCGVEFEQTYRELNDGKFINKPIHRENESRIRLMLSQNRKKNPIAFAFEITPHEGYEGCETWSQLTFNV